MVVLIEGGSCHVVYLIEGMFHWVFSLEMENHYLSPNLTCLSEYNILPDTRFVLLQCPHQVLGRDACFQFVLVTEPLIRIPPLNFEQTK